MTERSIVAILIDDEPKMLDVLKHLIQKHCPEIVIAATFTSPQLAYDSLPSIDPDVVFLDIQMPEYTGFQLLEKIGVHRFQVVFTTAYDNYAVQAFRVNALDYLLKPIDVDELKQVAGKLKNVHAAENNMMHKKPESNSNTSGTESIAKFPISASGGIKLVNLSDIIYLEADTNYTIFHFLRNKDYTASRNLAFFENQLPAPDFFRSHNSYLIHLRYVERYIKGDGGYVEMPDGRQLEVSRKKKAD
ncbi:MAG: LytR/AlgR family response regulator transcription factor, partial [Bacteroidia bacterium]